MGRPAQFTFSSKSRFNVKVNELRYIMTTLKIVHVLSSCSPFENMSQILGYIFPVRVICGSKLHESHIRSSLKIKTSLISMQ